MRNGYRKLKNLPVAALFVVVVVYAVVVLVVLFGRRCCIFLAFGPVSSAFAEKLPSVPSLDGVRSQALGWFFVHTKRASIPEAEAAAAAL